MFKWKLSKLVLIVFNLLCTNAYGQVFRNIQIEVTNAFVLPVKSVTDNSEQNWQIGNSVRKVYFESNSKIAYKPRYYYPSFSIATDIIKIGAIGLNLNLGYSKFGFMVGRLRFDTLKDYPKYSQSNGYFLNLPNWQKLDITEYRVGIFGFYDQNLNKGNLSLRFQLGAVFNNNRLNSNADYSFSSISDSSKYYSYMQGINVYNIKPTIVPMAKLNFGVRTKGGNLFSLSTNLSYINFSKIIRPVLVEYFNSKINETELTIPNVFRISIGFNYSFEISK